MPISTAFDPLNYITTTEAILKEFWLDYFPSTTNIITFEAPSSPTKSTIWFSLTGASNREVRTRRASKTIQGKELDFTVSLLSTNRQTSLDMAETFERVCLASVSVLGAAKLRYGRVTPFREVIETSQSKSYRRVGIFSMTVEIE